MAKTRIASVDEYCSVAAGDGPTRTQARAEHHPQSRTRRPRNDLVRDSDVQTGRSLRAVFRRMEAALLGDPSTDRLVAAFKNDLAPYEVRGKGTIRFPLSGPIPVKLIEGIAKFRAREVVSIRRLRGQQPRSANYCSAGHAGRLAMQVRHAVHMRTPTERSHWKANGMLHRDFFISSRQTVSTTGHLPS